MASGTTHLPAMGLNPSQFRRLRARLVGFGVSSGLKPTDAEDCAQEAILVLLRKYPGKDEVDAVPLAFRIMRWKITEHHRKASRPADRTSITLDDIQIKDDFAGANPEQTVALKEAVHGSLAQLSRKCRKLLLWQLEGLSGEEIAGKLGLPTRNAAYIAINRCKKRFKKAYNRLLRPPDRGNKTK